MSFARPRKRDVVLLRAGEIEQRRAEAFLFKQAHIHLQAAAEHELTLFSPCASFCSMPGYFRNMFGDGVDVLLFVVPGPHGHQQIEIADGFASAPQRSRRRDRFDRSPPCAI